MSKSCYMHFQPKKLDSLGLDKLFSDNSLEIMGIPIKAVKSTRFLGVTIDDELSWLPHIQKLTQKLNCQVGALSRIKDSVPQKFHKDLYYTLFESHLSYCISVWGGVAPSKLEPLFIVQKSCIRAMFGQELYLEKYMTCARCRPLNKQILDSTFYQKEHTKPLFKENEILTIHNIYIYHCFIELFKILKFRLPYSLFKSFDLPLSHARSTRHNGTYINIPYRPSCSIFTYKAAKIWNHYRTKLDILDFQVTVNVTKTRLKSLILSIQNNGNSTQWNNYNFCGYS